MKKENEMREQVRDSYGQIARQGGAVSCCQAGCSCGSEDPIAAAQKAGYSLLDLAAVPEGANLGLGCGNPLATADLKPGETVLDLGCGAGFDCFLARQRVGKGGHVIGVDMTADMINLARRNAMSCENNNIDFRLGEIEHLPVADNSVDVIISNCVLNLSPDKEQVFKEAWRVLKPGGRLAISDVVAQTELPDAILNDPALLTGCIAGAATAVEIRDMLDRTGFSQINITPLSNSG